MRTNKALKSSAHIIITSYTKTKLEGKLPRFLSKDVITFDLVIITFFGVGISDIYWIKESLKQLSVKCVFNYEITWGKQKTTEAIVLIV